VTSIRIWRGGLSDAPTLAALHAPSFSDAWPAAAFASLLERDEVIVLLGACGDGTSAQGFVLMRAVADEAEVLTFCVADGVRRSGLGGALLQAACVTALERGAAQMFLEVSEGNAAALGLYRREGFAEVGRRAAYYHHGPDASDAIVMRKSLNQAPPA
jgi:ribosomal-protein-alanine N-acetyltransferase